MLFVCLLLTLTLPLVTCPGQETAAHKTEVARDDLELERVTLDLEVLTRMFQSTYEIKQVADKDPAFMVHIKANEKPDQSQSIAELTALLQISPQAVAIATAHGFTARSYAVIVLCYTSTLLAFMMMETGEKPAEAVTQAHINPANLAFTKSHMSELETLGKKYPVSDLD